MHLGVGNLELCRSSLPFVIKLQNVTIDQLRKCVYCGGSLVSNENIYACLSICTEIELLSPYFRLCPTK